MPREIRGLADSILSDPASVSVDPPASTVELIDQNLYFVEKPDKVNLLLHIMKESGKDRVLIFTRTKHGADKVCKKLRRAGVRADAIHGNKSQNARERALAGFKRGNTRALVATDIASRGIDVENVSHVINYDLPNEPESYVHRIGRTGRAGMEGVAVSFCDTSEREYLPSIERLMNKRIHVVQEDYPYRSSLRPPTPTNFAPGRRNSAPKAKPAAGRKYSTKAPKSSRQWKQQKGGHTQKAY